VKMNLPMTVVPNLQGFPENGYPVSAYYGIDSTLQQINTYTGSGNAASGNDSLMPKPTSPYKYRTLITAFLIVVGAVVLWHYYMK
jgi:hypothetical protein